MLYLPKLEDHVREMKGLAEVLSSFTPPKHPPDYDISWLKSREIVLDGIVLIAHYSISDYGDIKGCILTIGGKNTPFIPFIISCKLARIFLGDENLTLFEYIKNGAKIYSWMVLFQDGKSISNFYTEKLNKENYNGFSFFRAGVLDEQEAIFGL